MKINQNSVVPNLESATKPDTELQKTAKSAGSPDGPTGLKEADAKSLGQQQLAKDARSFSHLTADLAKASLANQVPTRTQILQNAANDLRPALPQMLSKSGNDPDKFMAAVGNQLKSTNDRTYPNLAAVGDADIMALAFLVMMEASKSAREDLKEIMGDIKDINQQKQTMREMMQKLNEESSPTRKDDDD